MVSSTHNSLYASNHIPRYLAYLFAFYLALATPAAYAIGAAAETAATAAAARAAAALGAGEGLGAAALGLGAAAAVAGAFALAFCATSYVMGTGLCSPDDPSTGGGVANGINDPNSGYFVYLGGDGITYSTAAAACSAAFARTYDSSWQMTSCDTDVRGVVIVCARHFEGRTDCNLAAERKENSAGPAKRSPEAAGDAIASNPRATAAVAAAAASKARSASDATAVTAARAAATATGTGNPARDRAAGNTAAAAAAAAAAAEASGASPQEIEKAAKDAANTAAAAADKAQPQEKTCQSNGASIDGRYCTDTAVNPDAGALPVFCQWAVSVCGFFDWVKEEPVVATAEATNVNPEKDTYDTYNLPTNPQKSVTVNFGGQCPSDVTIPVFMGIEWKFSYNAACTIAGYAKYAFIGVASITAIFIVTGNREPD